MCACWYANKKRNWLGKLVKCFP